MLSSKQKAYLKSCGHDLRPIIQIGKEGLSSNSFILFNQALKKHELVKATILKTVEEEAQALVLDICSRCHCDFVQKIGRTLLFYRKGENNRYGL